MIEYQHISKKFGEQEVLKDISFQVPDGSRLCIVGGSGSGKSVTVKLLLGLETTDEGEIIIDQQAVRGFSQTEWRNLLQEFGVVFQGAALFDSLNVLENVGLKLFEERSASPSEIKQQVIEALDQVNLSPDILTKYPAELSGGMRKRVGISRAIIDRPRYLIYDEPTTGLDPLSSQIIDDLMTELSKEPGRTSIIITHDMYTVRKLATQVIMLHNQEIIFDGTSADFFSSDLPEISTFLSRI
ncbi:UNVERIFIED_CONTAM: hypothetical protein GTU68_021272 [Idotea baltica]|nr:hypothetical protein [Idotea baltica]